VPVRTGVPLREDKYCPASAFARGASAFARRARYGATRLRLGSEVQRVNRVVLRIPRAHRTWKRHGAGRAVDAWPECVVRCVGSFEEACAVRNGVRGPVEQDRFRRRILRMAIRLDPVEPPVEWPHHAVFTDRVKATLPRVKQSCDHTSIIFDIHGLPASTAD
jgi:hypothetical protein